MKPAPKSKAFRPGRLPKAVLTARLPAVLEVPSAKHRHHPGRLSDPEQFKARCVPWPRRGIDRDPVGKVVTCCSR